MATAYLGLGANIGDPAAQIEDALNRIAAYPRITIAARSRLIRTKAWGKADQPDFLNMVVAVESDLKPEALLEACLGIEQEMGRVRKERWGPRTIDIDVIAYDRLVLGSDRLTLPHPHAHEREFVLAPLREIAPEVADWLVDRVNAP